MNFLEKATFYNTHKETIHPLIKSNEITKPLWRRLYWTTRKDSDQYKAGCVAIFEENFPELFKKLK